MLLLLVMLLCNEEPWEISKKRCTMKAVLETNLAVVHRID